MEKELKVIEIPASGKPNWSGGAYCIAFLYTKTKGNLIVKGYYQEVEDYIKNDYTHYFVNYTLWSNGQSRSIWSFWADGYYISAPARKKDKPSRFYDNKPSYKWRLRKFFADDKTELTFRRFPKRWIKEFDNLK
jgi:hypothetical protein